MTQAASSTANTLTNGLIAYYPFNGDSLDHSGNGKNLSLLYTSFEPNGIFGPSSKALSVDGTYGGSYISNSLSPITNNFSISTWFNPAKLKNNPSEWMYLFSGVQTDSAFLSIGVGSKYPSNYLKIYLGYESPTDPGFSFATPSITDIRTNTWQNIVATVNGGKYSVYFNGNLVGSITNASLIPFDLNNYTIGNRGVNSSAYRVNGLINEFRLYNRALTAAEVTSLYNQFRPFPPLVYTLSGSGKIATDSTNQAITSSGYFVMCESNNASAFIWTSSSPTKSYRLETHSNIDYQKAGYGIGATTLFSMAASDGDFPDVEKDLIWLSGTNSSVALNSSNTITAPSTMSGYINTLVLQNGTQIQNESMTLTLDKTNTLTALTSGETLNSTISRLTNSLSKQGYSPAQ